MVKCAFCDKEVDEHEVKFSFSLGKKTYNICSLSCLYKSDLFEGFKHRSMSSLVLNKTLFEFFAILTGFGGVYYTLFEAGNNALIMDTISIVAAIAAMIIGVEHLRYVKEHGLIKKAVLFIGLTIVASIIIFVLLHGF